MDDIITQVPSLKKIFYKYTDYADATVQNIISKEKLASLKSLQVFTFSAIYLHNTGKGFEVKQLPVEAQCSPYIQFGVLI